jgi:glutamine---fructose-6-phosphate transaminase (isomerizing)
LNTIDAFERDVLSQLDYIRMFVPQKTILQSRLHKVVFSGSGDSLAAAMLAQSLSNYSVTAIDPLEIAENPKIAHNKHVYFVSISGNTAANIKAAKSVKNPTAITKNPSSLLAKACRSTITLQYVDSGVFTAGSIGFLASALVCISLVMPITLKNAKKTFLAAKKASEKVTLVGKPFFLGGQYTYPVAMYGAAKMYEVVGLDASYERMEQFSHMGMFCAKKNDAVIILDDSKHAAKLSKVLAGIGLDVCCPVYRTNDVVEKILFYIFFTQFLALGMARRSRQKECHFVLQNQTRNASSDMIY